MTAPIIDGVRTVRRAGLLAFGLVDQPAYPGSLVEARAFEIRQDGDGLAGRFMYDADTITSDRAEVRASSTRKSRVRPGAFRFALEDETREIQLLMGADYDRPLTSKLAGSLDLRRRPRGAGVPCRKTTRYVLRPRLPGSAGGGRGSLRRPAPVQNPTS